MKDVFINLGTELPIYLALSVGFFLAIVRWKDTPTASMILIILTPAWLFIKICFVLLYAFLPSMMASMDVNFENVRVFYRGLNCGGSLIEGLAIGLLIWAVFAPRAAADPKAIQAKM